MLKFFAERRFNMVDLTSISAATALIWDGHWLLSAVVWLGGLALSVALEQRNGQYQ